MTPDPENPNPIEAPNRYPDQLTTRIQPAQWYLVTLIVAFTIAALLYRVLRHQDLGHSAAMFLGLPMVLSILLALSPRAKTITGGILKGITLALLLLAPLLQEGFLCILIASPLFYLVGLGVGAAADHTRRKRNPFTLSCTTLVLLPFALEGTSPNLTVPRSTTTESRVVLPIPSDLVEQRLAQGLDLRTPLPLALRIGFPRPLQASGSGLDLGDTRTIHFSGAEHTRPGDLILRVTDRQPNFVRFTTVSDQTKLAEWIHWKDSEVRWTPIDAQHTAVTWRIHFSRQLDPSWYFGPLEAAAVHQAATYLIRANTSEISPGATR